MRRSPDYDLAYSLPTGNTDDQRTEERWIYEVSGVITVLDGLFYDLIGAMISALKMDA